MESAGLTSEVSALISAGSNSKLSSVIANESKMKRQPVPKAKGSALRRLLGLHT
jgi:hypothetical protein